MKVSGSEGLPLRKLTVLSTSICAAFCKPCCVHTSPCFSNKVTSSTLQRCRLAILPHCSRPPADLAHGAGSHLAGVLPRPAPIHRAEDICKSVADMRRDLATVDPMPVENSHHAPPVRAIQLEQVAVLILLQRKQTSESTLL